MGAGKEGDAVVILAETVVKCACPFIMRVFVGCDGQAKTAGKRLPQLREIEKGAPREELGTGAGTMDHGLDKGHLDSGITNVVEDTLDGIPSGNCIAVDEGLRLHADGNDERAKEIGLPGVGVGEGVDASPLHLERVE